MNIAISDRRKHKPTQAYIQFTFVYVATDLQLNFTVSLAEFYAMIRWVFKVFSTSSHDVCLILKTVHCLIRGF
jgi:hypothetical protein